MNEPIGLFKLKEDHHGSYYIQALPTEDNHNLIPLYTHPVKELTLTRDEIRDVWRKFPASFTLTPLTIEFARAILRKASEK